MPCVRAIDSRTNRIHSRVIRMVTRMRKITATALLLAFALSGPALAAQLKISTIETPPWAFVDAATGRPAGFFPAVVQELSRRTGISFVMSLQPFARISPEIEIGLQDCAMVVWMDGNERFAVKGGLVASHQISVIPGKETAISSYEDLKGLNISVLRGLKYPAPFETDHDIGKVVENDYISGIRKTVRGRVDAVAGATATLEYLAKSERLDEGLGRPFILGSMDIFLQFSQKSTHLDTLALLNAALSDMALDGTMDRLMRENFFK